MKKFSIKNELAVNELSSDNYWRNILLICKTSGLAMIVSLLMMSASLNVRGQLADSFSPSVNGGVGKIIIQPDGKILIGGSFTSVGGQTRNRIARLNADGTLDATFGNPNPDNLLAAITLQPDGKVLIGGTFSTVAGQTRKSIARLNADGTLDAAFDANVDGGSFGGIYSIEVDSNGKILIGGFFTNVGGQTRNRVARLNADCSLDTSFDPNFDSTVSAVKLQADGKILVGGVFSNVGSTARNRIARLNADGTLDTSFNSPFTVAPNGRGVYAIEILSDGRILVGGAAFNNDPINKIARLSANGTLDAAFNQNSEYIDGDIRSIAIQADGKILISGIIFNSLKPFRLNTDGTTDKRFNPNPNIGISAFTVQSDGKILVGGGFSIISGVYRNNIARISSVVNKPTNFDFNGDNIADQGVFRPSGGAWYVLRSNLGIFAAQFGNPTDKIAPADYDGDGRTDFAVFRDGFWYFLNSSNNSFQGINFGQTGDVPVPADYTGDGRAEIAVFRGGFWYLFDLSNSQFTGLQFGFSTDKPVAADYDGDGKADIAVVRQSGGLSSWYIQGSTQGFYGLQFGADTDKLVPADYDGDGKVDVAVVRQSGGLSSWYTKGSTTGFYGLQFGADTDRLVPADYDGDGKTDVAVYRDGFWYMLGSQQGFSAVQFGAATDKPIPAAYIP